MTSDTETGSLTADDAGGGAFMSDGVPVGEAEIPPPGEDAGPPVGEDEITPPGEAAGPLVGGAEIPPSGEAAGVVPNSGGDA